VHVEHGVDEQRVQRDAENRQAGLRGHHRDRSPRSPRAPDRMRSDILKYTRLFGTFVIVSQRRRPSRRRA
jgi:hypothetical protein